MYGYHYVSHADLEPQNCTAWHKGDSVEIWAPTQTPQAAVDAIAKLAGLPKDKVLLHQLRGGGGFGRRLANDSVCEAVLISKQAGNLPVKVQWMREDDMAFDYYRAGGFHSFKAAVDKSGKLSALSEPLHHLLDGRHDARVVRQHRQAEFPANVLREPAHGAVADRVEDPDGTVARAGQQRDRVRVQSFLNECAVAANRDHVEFLVELMGEPRKAAAGSVRRRVQHGPRGRRDQGGCRALGLGQARCRPAAGSGSRSTSATRGTSPRSRT